MRHSQSLRFLGLERNLVGPAGATLLAAALCPRPPPAPPPVLEGLSLCYNHCLGDEGVRSLAHALRRNDALESLNLVGCGVGDEGVRHLSAALESVCGPPERPEEGGTRGIGIGGGTGTALRYLGECGSPYPAFVPYSHTPSSESGT